MLEADIPEAAGFLFEPKRYKVLYGGRGSGKSHSIARALVILGYSKKLRILCAREVQKSIKTSVHQLLKDTIIKLGLEQFYQVLETEIRGSNGTQFLFSGLSDQTADSIKSFEGVNICWCEEAQVLSNRSLDILIPTIRAEGSEIWFSMNPELEDDPVYKRFVAIQSEDCTAIKMNWSENPFFPEILDKERKAWELRDPVGYKTVWDGQCRPTVEGAIYASEMADALANGRIRNVPYDPLLKVHTVWDLGWNDSMSIICVQRSASELRVIDYIEDSHRTLDQYVQDLRQRQWNWGTDYLPHDARSRDFKSGKSTEEILVALGRSVTVLGRDDIEEGIRSARMVFPRVYFDQDRCGPLLNSLKRYRRQINQVTGQPGAPLHDEHSHAADCFRYMSMSTDMMTNDSWGGEAIRRNLSRLA